MIEKVYFAVSNDETRYSLNGVFFKIIDSTLLLVSTDGHRLCKVQREIELSKEVSDAFGSGMILPRKGIMELKKLLETDDSDLSIGLHESNCFVVLGDLIFAMRLIDGEFPDYKKVIPSSFTKKAVVQRNELLDSLKRVSILSYDRAWGLKMDLDDKELVISSSNPNIGEARDVVPVKSYEGDSFTIGFNARYLIDGLQAMSDGDIVLEFNDELLPGLMKHLDDDEYLCVVMPMRI